MDSEMDILRDALREKGVDPDALLSEAARSTETPATPTTHAEVEATTPATGDEQEALANAFVSFMGREVEVRMMTTDQVLGMQQLMEMFNTATAGGASTISGERALRLTNMAFAAVLTILVSPDDRERLVEDMIKGSVALSDTIPLISAAMDALRRANQEQGNRAERRAQRRSSGVAAVAGGAALDIEAE